MNVNEIAGYFKLHILASWASIISLILTVYVFFTVRDIKKSFRRKARLPEIHKAILQNGKKLSSLLGDFNRNLQDIRVELGKAEQNVKPTSKVARELKTQAMVVTRSINEAQSALTEVAVRNTYVEIQKFITACDNAITDMRWE